MPVMLRILHPKNRERKSAKREEGGKRKKSQPVRPRARAVLLLLRVQPDLRNGKHTLRATTHTHQQLNTFFHIVEEWV